MEARRSENRKLGQFTGYLKLCSVFTLRVSNDPYSEREIELPSVTRHGTCFATSTKLYQLLRSCVISTRFHVSAPCLIFSRNFFFEEVLKTNKIFMLSVAEQLEDKKVLSWTRFFFAF